MRKSFWLFISLFIVSGCGFFQMKETKLDTRDFLRTRALQTYDFTRKDNEIELIIQFRDGGLKGEPIYASAPDDIFFNDEKLEQVNMPESLKAPFFALAYRLKFPSNLKGGTLKFVESGLNYYHQIDIPNADFGKFGENNDRKKPIRLPIINADQINRGNWTLTLTRPPYFIIDSAQPNVYPLTTAGNKVYLDLKSSPAALVINPSAWKDFTSDLSYFTVKLSAVFPCNSGDEVLTDENKPGIRCTYQTTGAQLYLDGKNPVPASNINIQIPKFPNNAANSNRNTNAMLPTASQNRNTSSNTAIKTATNSAPAKSKNGYINSNADDASNKNYLP